MNENHEFTIKLLEMLKSINELSDALSQVASVEIKVINSIQELNNFVNEYASKHREDTL